MPKAKKRAGKRKSTKATSPARKPARAKATKARVPKPSYSEEYTAYLERYALSSHGRPRLSPAEFDRLDDEMLDLLDLEFTRGLNDEQIVRLQELEFLLIDTEQ